MPQPLLDLTRDVKVDIPKFAHGKARKGAYKRALTVSSINDKWGPKQREAFLALKILLSKEPVVKPPQFDGRPFRITSDRSKVG